MVEGRNSILSNRKEIMLYHCNGKLHALVQRENKLHELNWIIVTYPSYSAAVAFSDFYLLRASQNNWDGEKFQTFEEKSIIFSLCKQKLNTFNQ